MIHSANVLVSLLGACLAVAAVAAILYIRTTNTLFALIRSEFSEEWRRTFAPGSDKRDILGGITPPGYAMENLTGGWPWRLEVNDPRYTRLLWRTRLYILVFFAGFGGVMFFVYVIGSTKLN
jgi:hypothetical protein